MTSDGGSAVETAPTIAVSDAYRWFSIFSVDGWVHVGGDGKTVMSRQPDGGWFASLGINGFAFYALAGVVNEEVFAAGTVDDAGTSRARFDGGSWAFSNPVMLPNGDTVHVKGMWAADANTYFIVGQETGPVIGVPVAAFVIATR